MHHCAIGDDGSIGTLGQNFSLADLETRIIALQRRHRHAADAHEDRAVHGSGRADRLLGLPGVGRHDQRQVVEQPQPGHILDGVVRRPQFAIGDAARLADQFYVDVGIGDVRLDLLHGPAGDEA
ncbi:hypothetical protein D3C87_1583380 [compost metagenome]